MRSIGLYSCTGFYCLAVLIALYSGSRVASFFWLFGIITVVALIFHARGTGYRIGVSWMVVGIILGLLRITFLRTSLPEGLAPLLDQKISVRGTIVAIPDLRETNTKLIIDIPLGASHTKVLATVPLYPPFHAGDTIFLSGTIKKPVPFATDGGRTFDYDMFLKKDDIYGVVPLAHAELIGRSASVWLRFLRLLEGLKEKLTKALGTALPEPESALAVGILVGGKQGLGARLIEDFTTSGMLQIIVLSGFNVMIVAAALMRILARFPKRLAFGIAAGSIMSFVLMAGAGSSAIRAGLMAGFALAARTFGRRYDVSRVICITLFLIALWNPLTLAYDPGFQFSFIATIGLVIGTPYLAPRLLFLRSATVIELVSTTLAAEIALLPLLLYETGNLSFVSVIANVLAMPVIPFAMFASAVTAALALPLAHLSSVLPLVLGLPAYVPLAYVIRIATLSASLPFANRIVDAFPFWLVLVSYAALAFLLHYLSRPPRPGSDSQRRPSSGSQETPQRMSSCPLACSQPCTHAPKGRAQA
jgi:competence protein ComEC